MRLETNFSSPRSRSLRERAPASSLPRAPTDYVDRAGRHWERSNKMAPIRANINWLQIVVARGCRAVVGFYQAAVIMIEQAERTPFRVHVALIQLPGNRNISDGRVHPAPTIHLKHAPRGNRTDSGEIPRATRVNVVRTVKASHHVRKTKSAYQSLRDTVVLHGCECGICRFHLTAICEFKTAQLHTGVISLQTNEGLLRKNEGRELILVVGRIIRGSQP